MTAFPEIPFVTIVDRDTATWCFMGVCEYPGLDAALSIYDSTNGPPDGFSEWSRDRHALALGFDDVTRPFAQAVPPDPVHARQIVAWARGVKTRALVHCAAGVSRSTAAATAIPACRLKPSQENARAIMRWLVDVRPCAMPNPLLVLLIDRELGWSGHLEQARAWRFPRW